MFCSKCGTQLPEAGTFCSKCGNRHAHAADMAAGDHAPAMHGQPMPFASMHDEIPDGVRGWSWGAFLLNWIWAIGNRTWIGLLAMLPYIGLIVAIWLGIKGREMAWKNGNWKSVEHFNRVQKRWSYWGLGLVAIAMVGIMAAVSIPAYQEYMNRSKARAMEASMQSLATDEAADGELATAASEPGAASGTIDTNADDLPASLTTVAGVLARASASDDTRVVTLDRSALFDGEDAKWQFPVRSFSLSEGREAILMASSGGRGNSCETLFFFLMADRQGVKPTPMFGTCSPQATFEQRGDAITLRIPGVTGESSVVLSDGAVEEDGHLLAMNDMNDPSK